MPGRRLTLAIPHGRTPWAARARRFAATVAALGLTGGCQVPRHEEPPTTVVARGSAPVDREPNWVAVSKGSPSPDPVPGVVPSVTPKPAPPDGVDVVAKDPATPAAPPQLVVESPAPFPPSPRPEPRPLPPGPRPTADESLLLVGGVPVALPPDAGKPTARPATNRVPDPPRVELPPLEPVPPANPAAVLPEAPALPSIPLAPPPSPALPAPGSTPPPGTLPIPVAPRPALPFDPRWYPTPGPAHRRPVVDSPRHGSLWQPLPSAAFFADSPLPVTQTRLRWDSGWHLAFPDRGEFFWARADGPGRGPWPNPAFGGVPYLDYHELYLDQEIASGPLSVTLGVPARWVDPSPFARSTEGFGDLQLTAKGLLFENERFLLALQLRSYLPVGSYRQGIGTGHATLEPGVIAGVRLGPDTYAAAQLQEWIPLSGDPDYAGSALRYHFALNQVLWRPAADVQLIGTWELTGFGFHGGAYTDPLTGLPQPLAGQAALSMGIGGRLFVSDRWDAGAAWAHAISGKYLMRDQLRLEFRYRY